jgi:uncharacterized membrane protein YphA (DoxX/SURF4 family)
MELAPFAWLLFRATYSWVFLNAAWQCGKSRAGIEWTIAESSILFGRMATVLGPLGILVMAFGGLSILLGAFAELGGIMLAMFLVPGTVIHLRKRREAASLAGNIRSRLEAGSPPMQSLDALTVLADLGHYSSAMKNISLLGPAVFFAVMGPGPYALARLWGMTLGGR